MEDSEPQIAITVQLALAASDLDCVRTAVFQQKPKLCWQAFVPMCFAAAAATAVLCLLLMRNVAISCLPNPSP